MEGQLYSRESRVNGKDGSLRFVNYAEFPLGIHSVISISTPIPRMYHLGLAAVLRVQMMPMERMTHPVDERVVFQQTLPTDNQDISLSLVISHCTQYVTQGRMTHQPSSGAAHDALVITEQACPFERDYPMAISTTVEDAAILGGGEC